LAVTRVEKAGKSVQIVTDADVQCKSEGAEQKKIPIPTSATLLKSIDGD
jgi:hypothetical protein